MSDDDPPPSHVGASVQIVTVICLTVVVFTAIVGITVTAVMTDRDVRYAEGLSFGGALFIGLIGGLTLRGVRRQRRRHWRIERDENGNGRAL